MFIGRACNVYCPHPDSSLFQVVNVQCPVPVVTMINFNFPAWSAFTASSSGFAGGAEPS